MVPPAPQVIAPSGEHDAPASPSSALVGVVPLVAGFGARAGVESPVGTGPGSPVAAGVLTPLSVTVFVTIAGVGCTVTVTDPVEVTMTVLVEVPVPARAGSASALLPVAAAAAAEVEVVVELLTESGATTGAGSVEVPAPLTVTLTLLSKLHGEMSVTPGVFPLTNFPPNSTEGPGLGYTTSTSPGVIHWVPPKMLASYI